MTDSHTPDSITGRKVFRHLPADAARVRKWRRVRPWRFTRTRVRMRRRVRRGQQDTLPPDVSDTALPDAPGDE